MKGKKSDLVTHPHSILARWRKHFCQLLNENWFKVARQKEIHTAEPLVHKPSAFEFETPIKKLKSLMSLSIDQIPAEPIKARVEKFALRSINLLIIQVYGIRRNGLRNGRSRLLYLSIKRAMKQILVVIWSYHVC